MRKILLYIIICAAAAACTESFDEPERKLVLEAWIDTDGYPVALLTETFSPGSSANVSDIVVKWGKVSISDGTDTIVMTGSYSADYFPPYRYFNYTMEGKPGKTYTISAEYDGMTVSARARMAQPTPIDSIVVSNIEGEDSLKSGMLYFTAPEDCPAYYYLTVRNLIDHTNTQPGLAMLSTTEVTEPAKKVSIPIYNPKNHVDSTSYVANLMVGQNLEIKLCRVEREIYEFWHDYDNYVMFGNSQFISNQGSLRGNIENGFGIFSVQATSTSYIKVENSGTKNKGEK